MANYGESSLPMAMANQTAGILWGLLGVISLSFSGILNRITAQRGFGCDRRLCNYHQFGECIHIDDVL